ncbi:MAG: A/G-specific adenine glycosylase [Gammaproteobacteria bacterium]|nr:A/G-specific adenine glycosylase [Gammaproteobacteria bacterium]MDH5727937.1 A/G-specific adenine glycosylase [Gammaproteobacteria bacterium]
MKKSSTKPLKPEQFAQQLLAWYDINGRKNLPWHQQANAYKVWLSEIMLQQTQVTTVIPYFQRFLRRFPTLSDLAGADLDSVLSLWSGLGYYARARNLHACARQILDKHHGEFPQDYETVMQLPGVGRSTAAAILAQAFGQRHAILDGNVKRVLARLHCVAGWPGSHKTSETLWTWAEHYTPYERLADYTQAIMDLGALICSRGKPKCVACPITNACLAHQTQTIEKFPEPKPKKHIQLKKVRMLLIANDKQELLLAKRPPAGIWGGLWSLPECPWEQDIETWINQTLGIICEPLEEFNVIRHSFSHFNLDIYPVLLKTEDNAVKLMEATPTIWYKRRLNSKYGLAKPVQTLVEYFFDRINTGAEQ